MNEGTYRRIFNHCDKMDEDDEESTSSDDENKSVQWIATVTQEREVIDLTEDVEESTPTPVVIDLTENESEIEPSQQFYQEPPAEFLDYETTVLDTAECIRSLIYLAESHLSDLKNVPAECDPALAVNIVSRFLEVNIKLNKFFYEHVAERGPDGETRVPHVQLTGKMVARVFAILLQVRRNVDWLYRVCVKDVRTQLRICSTATANGSDSVRDIVESLLYHCMDMVEDTMIGFDLMGCVPFSAQDFVLPVPGGDLQELFVEPNLGQLIDFDM